VQATTEIGFAASVLLAHQGGWDEILLVAGPIIVIVGLLALAKRRIERSPAVDDPRSSPDDDAG
jgi:hypothetical protein